MSVKGTLIGTLIAAFLMLAPFAQAANFLPPFNNGAHQAYYHGPQLTDRMASATTWTRTENINPTDMNTSRTDNHDASHVAVFDGQYSDSWAGFAPCDQYMWGNNNICTHWHVFYNMRLESFFSTNERRHHLACQETGHTTGLEHVDNMSSCLGAWEYTHFTDHDRRHINGRY